MTAALRRHALAGYSAGGVTHEKLDRFTAEKHIKKAKPVYYPEEGLFWKSRHGLS